jgi:hypothetical protein
MAEVYMTALALPMKELRRLHAAFSDFAAQHELPAMLTPEQVDAAVLEVRSPRGKYATWTGACQGCGCAQRMQGRSGPVWVCDASLC